VSFIQTQRTAKIRPRDQATIRHLEQEVNRESATIRQLEQEVRKLRNQRVEAPSGDATAESLGMVAVASPASLSARIRQLEQEVLKLRTEKVEAPSGDATAESPGMVAVASPASPEPSAELMQALAAKIRSVKSIPEDSRSIFDPQGGYQKILEGLEHELKLAQAEEQKASSEAYLQRMGKVQANPALNPPLQFAVEKKIDVRVDALEKKIDAILAATASAPPASAATASEPPAATSSTDVRTRCRMLASSGDYDSAVYRAVEQSDVDVLLYALDAVGIDKVRTMSPLPFGQLTLLCLVQQLGTTLARDDAVDFKLEWLQLAVLGLDASNPRIADHVPAVLLQVKACMEGLPAAVTARHRERISLLVHVCQSIGSSATRRA